MPTFDFKCLKCEATFEYARPFGSTEKPKCTECSSKRTEKLISTPAVHFKGSGFYKTDSTPKKTKSKKKTKKKETKKTA